MSKLAPALIATLAILGVGEGIALWRMDRRLSRLEAAPPAATGHRRSAEVRPVDGGVAEIAAASEGVRVLEQRVTVLEREREAASAPAAPGAAGTSRDGATAADAAFRRRLEEVVERKVAERLADREKEARGGDEKKPSIAELSAAVSMSTDQEDAAVRVLDDGKRRMFELLGLPRADGTSLLDDLVTSLKTAEDPGKAMQGWFQRLLSERIPGRPDAYIAEIVRIQKSVWEGLGAALDEGQVTKLRRLGLDVLQVNTGYDPFAELLAR